MCAKETTENRVYEWSYLRVTIEFSLDHDVVLQSLGSDGEDMLDIDLNILPPYANHLSFLSTRTIGDRTAIDSKTD